MKSGNLWNILLGVVKDGEVNVKVWHLLVFVVLLKYLTRLRINHHGDAFS